MKPGLAYLAQPVSECCCVYRACLSECVASGDQAVRSYGQAQRFSEVWRAVAIS